jgi:2-polyprenyl-6-methoxyphenol hydroxylase-like FAD-dependent oxidoreductase
MGEQAESTPAEPYQLALMVPQFVTERILRDRLSEFGCKVAFGRELIDFEQDAEGVTARIAVDGREETIRVRWLVGADGGRSFVRQALGIGFQGKTLGVRAVVADVALTGLSRDVVHRFARGGDMDRQIWVGPLAGTSLFQIQAPIPMEGDVDLSAGGLTAFIAERTGRSDIAVESVSWASAYQMNARLADGYRVGRVFLAGDAAHVHPPTGGQGLNTSVQDAYNLGWKLAAVIKGAGNRLLETYEGERRPAAEAVLGLSTQLLDAQKQGAMRRGREVRQLDIGYPQSLLSLELPKREGGLLAGDRAPDAPCMGAAGQPLRLFQLFKGPHWTLLVFEDGRHSIPPRPGLHMHHIGPRGNVIDTGTHIRDAYGLAPGECVLIRPDGYVGAIASVSQARELEVYLADVGLPALEGGLR